MATICWLSSPNRSKHFPISAESLCCLVFITIAYQFAAFPVSIIYRQTVFHCCQMMFLSILLIPLEELVNALSNLQWAGSTSFALVGLLTWSHCFLLGFYLLQLIHQNRHLFLQGHHCPIPARRGKTAWVSKLPLADVGCGAPCCLLVNNGSPKVLSIFVGCSVDVIVKRTTTKCTRINSITS